MSGRPKGITQQLQHIVQLEKRKGEATEFRKGALQLEQAVSSCKDTLRTSIADTSVAQATLAEAEDISTFIAETIQKARKSAVKVAIDRNDVLAVTGKFLVQLAKQEALARRTLTAAACMAIHHQSNAEAKSSFDSAAHHARWLEQTLAVASADDATREQATSGHRIPGKQQLANGLELCDKATDKEQRAAATHSFAVAGPSSDDHGSASGGSPDSPDSESDSDSEDELEMSNESGISKDRPPHAANSSGTNVMPVEKLLGLFRGPDRMVRHYDVDNIFHVPTQEAGSVPCGWNLHQPRYHGPLRRIETAASILSRRGHPYSIVSECIAEMLPLLPLRGLPATDARRDPSSAAVAISSIAGLREHMTRHREGLALTALQPSVSACIADKHCFPTQRYASIQAVLEAILPAKSLAQEAIKAARQTVECLGKCWMQLYLSVTATRLNVAKQLHVFSSIIYSLADELNDTARNERCSIEVVSSAQAASEAIVDAKQATAQQSIALHPLQVQLQSLNSEAETKIKHLHQLQGDIQALQARQAPKTRDQSLALEWLEEPKLKQNDQICAASEMGAMQAEEQALSTSSRSIELCIDIRRKLESQLSIATHWMKDAAKASVEASVAFIERQSSPPHPKAKDQYKELRNSLRGLTDQVAELEASLQDFIAGSQQPIPGVLASISEPYKAIVATKSSSIVETIAQATRANALFLQECSVLAESIQSARQRELSSAQSFQNSSIEWSEAALRESRVDSSDVDDAVSTQVVQAMDQMQKSLRNSAAPTGVSAALATCVAQLKAIDDKQQKSCLQASRTTARQQVKLAQVQKAVKQQHVAVISRYQNLLRAGTSLMNAAAPRCNLTDENVDLLRKAVKLSEQLPEAAQVHEIVHASRSVATLLREELDACISNEAISALQAFARATPFSSYFALQAAQDLRDSLQDSEGISNASALERGMDNLLRTLEE